MRLIVFILSLFGASAVIAADLAITNVTVIDGSGGPNTPNQTVLIEDGRITEIGNADSLVPPPGAHPIDGTGKFLMPGWIDTHIHLIGVGQWRGLDNPPGVAIDYDEALSALHGFLYVGVTSVYDAGKQPRPYLHHAPTGAGRRDYQPAYLCLGPCAQLARQLDGGFLPWHRRALLA
jgi:hypothetical protein